MNMGMEERLAEALAEFEETRARLADAAAAASRISATVTAKDRSVTVTMGPQGELTQIRFPTNAYRGMPPARLSAVLMSTISLARKQAAEQLADIYRPFGPIPVLSPDAQDGVTEPDWEAMFAPAREEGIPTPPVKPPHRGSGALLDELVEDEETAAAVREEDDRP
ncbi:YbaB/EbfC family nucleoid-associated protein [Streptomyces roseicoloratus]|uniref:YbaB/EbfC family nucleoid-associated protein n=1 Tax=Streptomyces roseicoloratus TaxID=2508722 RepID=A0ABY9RPH9_9ACTN|nr:YbaB/EbfC family nucleoid-associated protein [Streptomyces roseicoloratus]WMX43817.1 YbaB/EbfC family nucleoid-associated protein [Streptomyces roseicoloratus]